MIYEEDQIVAMMTLTNYDDYGDDDYVYDYTDVGSPMLTSLAAMGHLGPTTDVAYKK